MLEVRVGVCTIVEYGPSREKEVKDETTALQISLNFYELIQ